MDSPADYIRFAVGMAVMSTATIALLRLMGAGLGWLPLWALVRAVVQLGAVALLLRGILAAPATVSLFVLLMLSTASWTSMQRQHQLWHGRRAAVTGVCAGAAVTLVAVFALGLLDLNVRYVVAAAGIIIGNSMSASTLAGRNFLRNARTRTQEIEAWLALGASPARAHRDIGQEAVRESLIPNLDQAKSTGLVTLPGAFVGALFGGATPLDAARFQLVVLAGIALAMTITACIVVLVVRRTPFLLVP